MSIMTSSAAIQFRGVLRKSGITRIAMRYLRQRDYEALLTSTMKKATAPSSCVWDIGANVGHYSRLFSEWSGPKGSVIAFEPSRETRDMMCAEALPSNITLLPYALAAESGKAWLNRGDKDDGATAQVSDAGTEQIEIETGDNIAAQGHPQPNLIKIDVEGFELDVLKGMPKVLANDRLTDIFIEVHFAIFGRTGRNDHPKEIENLLRKAGFGISWVDQSHIHARR